MLLGLAIFISGAVLVLLLPTLPAFIIALILGMLGKYVFDPTMQAYLGDRIPYEQRGRVVAITEMGWSLSFILGIPIMGYLISRFGWRAPYPALALAGLLVFLALARLLPKDPLPDGKRPGIRRNFQLCPDQ